MTLGQSVLVDTSVWIRFLANREPFARRLDELLQQRRVTAHTLIGGELLMGDTGGRAALLASYELLPLATVAPHQEVVEFARVHALTGRGIGWIDVQLLASAVVDRLPLWTADHRLEEIANELSVSFVVENS